MSKKVRIYFLTVMCLYAVSSVEQQFIAQKAQKQLVHLIQYGLTNLSDGILVFLL